ncbi:MAG: hypothetical protein LW650_13885, partial [Planctomycetaceae bacterium]|nr:hypothetical protein [Planctomycetaceae bacterium]
VADLQARLAELTAQHTASAADAASLRAAVTDLSADRDRAQAELAAALADAQSRADQLASLEDALTANRAAAQNAESAWADAESKLEDAAARINQLQAELSDASSSSAAALADLTAQRDQALQQARQSAQTAQAAEHSVASLSAELEAARNGGEAELQDLRRDLDQREESLRVLAQRLLNAEERLLASDAEIGRLRERCAAAEGSVAALAEGVGPSEFVALRRRRLARYKELLSAQSRKIMAARNAMIKKQQECEDLLQQRARVAEQAEKVAIIKAQVERRAARNKSATLILCLAAAFAIIGGMAWVIGGRLSPAFYAATATLRAETPGREPSGDEASTWTTVHEQIARDPDLYAAAAQRFVQRGMTTLGTPAAVKQRFDSDLTFYTDQAGRLTFELRGQGRERTERELETYVLTLMHQANAFREQRGDGAVTVIATPVKAGSEPILDPRLGHVAGVGGAGLLAFGLLFVGMYRLMSRSKQQFDLTLARAAND